MFGQSSTPFGSSGSGFGQPTNTAPVFGSPAPAAGGLFGSPAPAPAFGAPAAPGGFGGFGAAPAPPAAGFGSSTFGAPAPSTFGAPASGGFGGFGSTPAPAFGAPAPTPGVFGAPAPSASPFGSTTSTFGSAGSSFGTFGAPSPAPSGFGAPAPSGGLFGSSPAPAPFGAPAPAPFGAPAPAPFGAPAGGLFGTPAPAPFGAPAPAPGVFGAAPAPSGGLFGSAPAPAFGAPAAPAGGLFGAAPSTAPGQPGVGTAAVPYSVSNRQDGTSSINLQAITAMQQYEQKSFEELRVEDYSQGNRGKASTPTAGNTSGGFGFGAPAPSGGLFGSSPAPAPFGAPAPAPFGAPAPAPFGAPAGGLFGAPAPAPFGAPAPGGGLFGSNPSPAPAPFGAFGAAPAPAGGGLFGTTPAPAPFGAPAPGGLFGSTPAPAPFGAPAPAGGLFGSSPAPAPFGAPAPSGGLFGSTTGGSLFGAPAPSGGGLFGSAPASGGFGFGAKPPGTSVFGSPTPAPGGFGFGAPAPAPFGAPVPSAFGAPQAAAPNQAAMQPGAVIIPPAANEYLAMQIRALETQQKELEKKQPWGGVASGKSSTTPVSATEADSVFFPSRSLAASSSSYLGSSPRSSTMIRPRGFPQAEASKRKTNGSSGISPFGRDNTNLVPPEAHLRSNVMNLVVKPDAHNRRPKLRLALEPPTATPTPPIKSPPMESVLSPPPEGNLTPKITSAGKPSPSSSKNGSSGKVTFADASSSRTEPANSPSYDYYKRVIGASDDALDHPNTPTGGSVSPRAPKDIVPVLTKKGYKSTPTIDELSTMSEADLAAVSGFSVARDGYGMVEWEGSVDVRGADLNRIVSIEDQDVSVYTQDEEEGTKPPVGSKLNRPAYITFYGVFPKSGPESSDDEKDKFAAKVQRITKKIGAELISYDKDAGVWKIRVLHFSRYGLLDDDDEDAAAENLDVSSPEPKTLHFHHQPEIIEYDNGQGLSRTAKPLLQRKATPYNSTKTIAFRESAEILNEQDEPLPRSMKPVLQRRPTPYSPSDAVKIGDDMDVSGYSVSSPTSNPVQQRRATPYTGRSNRIRLLDEDDEDDGMGMNVSYENDVLSMADQIRTKAEEAARAIYADRDLLSGRSNRKSTPLVSFHDESDTADEDADEYTPTVPVVAPTAEDIIKASAGKSICQAMVQKAKVASTRLDYGAQMGRSFRVGWLPDGSLISVRPPGTKANPGFVKHRPSLSSSEAVKDSIALLEAQTEHAVSVSEEGSICPVYALPSGSSDCASLHEILMKFRDFTTVEEVKHAFALLGHLLDDRHDEADNANEGQPWDEFDYDLRCVAAVTIAIVDFCMSDVENDIHTALSRNDKWAAIFAAISGGNIERACEVAEETGCLHLAAVLSSSMEGRDALRQQLTELREKPGKRPLPLNLNRILDDIAGMISTENKLFRDGQSSLDWRRRLSLRLMQSPHEKLAKCLQKFEESISAREVPYPSPLYMTGPRISGVQSVFYRLLPVFTDKDDLQLADIVEPKNYTSEPHDFSSAFHLMNAVLAIKGEQAPKISAATVEYIKNGYEAQLVSQGHWNWAVYVALTSADGESTSWQIQRAKNYILQHFDTEKVKDHRYMLESVVGIPSKWMAEALAYRAAYRGGLQEFFLHATDFDAPMAFSALEHLMLPYVFFLDKAQLEQVMTVVDVAANNANSLSEAVKMLIEFDERVMDIAWRNSKLTDEQKEAELPDLFELYKQLEEAFEFFKGHPPNGQAFQLLPTRSNKMVPLSSMLAEALLHLRYLKVQLESTAERFLGA